MFLRICLFGPPEALQKLSTRRPARAVGRARSNAVVSPSSEASRVLTPLGVSSNMNQRRAEIPGTRSVSDLSRACSGGPIKPFAKGVEGPSEIQSESAGPTWTGPDRTAVSPHEGPGSQPATPPANETEVSPDRVYGVRPPEETPSRPQLPLRSSKAEAYMKVQPDPQCDIRNLKHTQRVVLHTYGVNMKWRRRGGWQAWMLTYCGPRDVLSVAAKLAEDCLINPTHYEDPPAKEQREFASVAKW